MGRDRLKGERLPNLSVVAEETPPPPGRPLRWLTGTAEESAPWRSHPQPRSLVQHGLVRRSSALGVVLRDPQDEFATRRPSLLCVPTLTPIQREDPLLVCHALAAGGDLPGGAAALGLRDAEAVVTFGDTKNHTAGAVGAVLSGHSVLRIAIAGRYRQRVLFGGRLGTTRLTQPSSMRWPWCARSCGLARLFTGRPRKPRR
jgi:hypothetical protein